VTLGDDEAEYDWGTWKGNTKLDQSVPIYTSIMEWGTDGTVRISYLFLYGFNAGGPTMDVKAELTGVSIKTSITAGDYGIGVHYSDVEHIEVTLNSGYSSIKQIKYAYHKWSQTLTSGYTLESSTHPVVFVAQGSHSSWPTGGSKTYETIWSEKDKEDIVVATVTVYDTYGKLVDYPPAKTSTGVRYYSTNPRLLKLNGSATTTTSMTTAETYCGFKYSGRLGATYADPDIDGLKDDTGYNTMMDAMYYVDRGTYNDIDAAMDDAMSDAMLETPASNCFYGRSFW
jgi:hypothetical protein